MSVGWNILPAIGQAGPGIGPPGHYSGGPLILDDAGTVAHVTWNGSALVDSFGNSWTQNGTVPQVGKAGKTPAGAGPFSDVNYYSLGTGNDVLDFAGDFTVAVVWSATALTDDAECFIANGVFGASGAGWRVLARYVSADLLFDTYSAASGLTRSATAAGAAQLGLNVICVGRSGTNQIAKCNLSAATTTAGTKTVVGTSQIAKIGRDEGAGGSAGQSIIREVWASSTAISDALATSIANRVKTRAAVTAW